MTATLIVLVPLALLGIVALLGFVGCALHAGGLQIANPYQDLVTGENSLVVYWPLDETTGTTASELSANKFDGMYLSGLGMSSYDGTNLSAAASGNVTINQMPGIVFGDAFEGNPPEPCPLFDGGIVRVDWKQLINNFPPFTVEAWVKPGWVDADPPAVRGVVVSLDTTSNAGFGLFATQDNFWSFVLGVGKTLVQVTGKTKINLDGTTIYYLAAAYDGANCSLFVGTFPGGVVQDGQGTTIDPMDPTQKFVQLPASTPLFIGAARPDLPTSPPAPPPVPPPLFPFKGLIQDVAIYNVAFDMTIAQKHFSTAMPG